jgi:hypothetical protein
LTSSWGNFYKDVAVYSFAKFDLVFEILARFFSLAMYIWWGSRLYNMKDMKDIMNTTIKRDIDSDNKHHIH